MFHFNKFSFNKISAKIGAYIASERALRGKDLFLYPDILSIMLADVVINDGVNGPAEKACIVPHSAVFLCLFIQIAVE